jgi:hypothetical protein
MTEFWEFALIALGFAAGYFCATSRPGSQRRFIRMAISVPDTSSVTLSLEPTDAKGVPTGPAFSDAVFTADSPAAVSITSTPEAGQGLLVLNSGNEPPVLTTIVTGTTPSDPSVNVTLTVNWEPTAQTGATIVPVVNP